MPRSNPNSIPVKVAPTAGRLTKRERQRQLLDCAKQVFAERGFFGTTLEVVADAAGVTETLLARHFADVAELMDALLRDVRKGTLERWQSETAVLPDPLNRLHAAVELLLGGARSDHLDYTILRRALADCETEALGAPLRSLFTDTAGFLAGVITEGQLTGVIRRSLDPHVGAWKLLHAGLGQLVTQPLGLPLQAEPDALGRAVECLLNGLLKTDV